MRNTHHMFRAISLTVGLVLLVVTGTAAMMATFSGPESTPLSFDRLMAPAPVPSAEQNRSLAGGDHLLYQRVARADGTQIWELTPVPAASPVQPNPGSASVVIRPDLDAPGLSRVSYSLQARPSGINKFVKPCNNSTTSSATKSKTLATYDLSCTTLG